MHELADPATWLPLAFTAVLGLAMLVYVVLDGYDLGVGVLLRAAPDDDKDMMVAAIGPFWDANETWLVLGVGVLLTAFPRAHGAILSALYLPVALMLVGLILRGVSFDFRAKAHDSRKALWNQAFFAGSLLAGFAQGFMLGLWVVGFRSDAWAYAFAVLIGGCLVATYALLGAGWLILKTQGPLQLRAVRWAHRSLGAMALGIAAMSVATPLVSERIFDKWFSLPYVVLLAPIPLTTAALFFIIHRSLRRLPMRLAQGNEYGTWVPFGCSIGVLVLAFYGLAYSVFPYLVMDQLTLWQAASSVEALWALFIGVAVVLPVIAGYTVYAYRVFSGKARALEY
jgi:cytochrome d ubiquinol oxidase subunit II